MTKSIFNKYVNYMKCGHSTLDEVAVFYSFPHYPRPYDEKHRKEDADSFPFIFYGEEGKERLSIGNHADSYDDVMKRNSIDAESVVLNGRGWWDAHCMVIDTAYASMNTLLTIQLSMQEDFGIDIRLWNVYNNKMQYVVPADIYRHTTITVAKRVLRIIEFFEEIVIDKTTFSDYIKEHPDAIVVAERKKQIQESSREYDLTYRCGLLRISEEEYRTTMNRLTCIKEKLISFTL